MSRDDGQRIWWLWFLVGAGPGLWFADHAVTYGIGPPAGRSTTLGLVRDIHVVVFSLMLVTLALSLRELARVGVTAADDDVDIRHGRSRLLAIAAVGFASIGVLLVAGNLVVSLLLAGQEP
jgi:hypothetical protein